MGLRHSTRITAAVIILSSASLLSIGRYCLQRNPFAPYSVDAITRNLHRFDTLKKTLPSHATVGYISDALGDDGNWDYYQTQYELSPIIIDRTANREIVIGNFRDANVVQQILMENDLTVQKDLGNGVLLLARRTP
jgi:hypothetical protein